MKHDNKSASNVHPPFEWSGTSPSSKKMGATTFVLDEGLIIQVDGVTYGIEHTLQNDDFLADLYFDHYNQRLRVLEYKAKDYKALAARISWLCKRNGFGKAFIKAKKEDHQQFVNLGFILEGSIPNYFPDQDCMIVSRFYKSDRSKSEHIETEDKIVHEAQKLEAVIPQPLEQGLKVERATTDDIEQLTKIYRETFATYPSPMAFPDYIASAMKSNVVFRVVKQDDCILAAAGADRDQKHKNAEMTDCATLPVARGKGLMKHILHALEADLQRDNIDCAYTLCRATSVGMNRVFSRLGYRYTGRLINNCDISGRFEDMNVWTKTVRK